MRRVRRDKRGETEMEKAPAALSVTAGVWSQKRKGKDRQAERSEKITEETRQKN